MMDWIYDGVRDALAMQGAIQIPGDKSISHRAVMLGSIANGISEVNGFLPAQDTLATVGIFRNLGVSIEQPSSDRLSIHGVGLHGLKGSDSPLDCGNSGTAMRLLAGLLSGQKFSSQLTGDASLVQRPMQRVIDPLTLMGAQIESAQFRPPLRIQGGKPLAGIPYQSPVPSAQVKSCVLLAGLYARGETHVEELHPTRDYTERLLSHMGWPIEFEAGTARLSNEGELRAAVIDVAGDFSSAAFFIVAATLIPKSNLLLKNVGIEPTRTGLLHALSLMGANISVGNMRETSSGRVGDITVRHASLEGTDVPAEIVPDMIDEFPVLFAAAALANGTTTVSGAAELRVKESDRIEAMVDGLREMGIDIEPTPDGAIIQGAANLKPATVDSHGDHRIAMSFAVLAAAASVPVRIKDVGNVATSFPEFAGLMRTLGVSLSSVTA